MEFETFKDEIQNAYAKKFDGICEVKYSKVFGGSIFIDFYLAKNINEFPHRISQNDMFKCTFVIHLDGTNFDDAETITLQSMSNSIKAKSTERCLYCEYKKVSFRKTVGSPEKIVKTLEKFIDKLNTAVHEVYDANMLLDNDVKLVETNVR